MLNQKWLYWLLVLAGIAFIVVVFEWTANHYQSVVIGGSSLVSHRLVSLFCAGALLAMSAQLLQAMYRTPMADTWTLGLTPACAVFSLLLLPLDPEGGRIALTSFAGAAMALVVWRFLLRRQRESEPGAIFTQGMTLALFCLACTGALLHLPLWQDALDPYWVIGNVTVLPVAFWAVPVTVLAFAACLVMAPSLDLLARGEHQALVLGVEVRRLKRSCYVALALMTGAAFLLVGATGFVGMLAMLIVRPLAGSSNRMMLPWSLVVGGGIMVALDWLAHVPFAATFPTGLLAAVIGLIVLLWYQQHAASREA